MSINNPGLDELVHEITMNGYHYLENSVYGGYIVLWVYEARLYESKSVASYVAMCLKDDHLLRGADPVNVQVYRTRRGNYGVRYQPEAKLS